MINPARRWLMPVSGISRIALVWALDRFTREGIEVTFAYVRQLKDGGVDFISYTEPHFRTTGPAGTFMLAVAAWIAEQERKRISDRTKTGMETARLRGKVLGRPVKQIDATRVQELHFAATA
jgi:DNA invertase Pin-like site-specific DNA recombinase